MGDHDASQSHCSSTNAGQKTGTLIDLATYYITDKTASKLNLRSDEIILAVHNVGGMKIHVVTSQYLLKI